MLGFSIRAEGQGVERNAEPKHVAEGKHGRLV